MEQRLNTKAAWVRKALNRYEQPLIRYAASITGDLELARDVVQESFVALCAADQSQVEERLAAWLYTVTRNRALNLRKKELRMTPLSPSDAEQLVQGGDGPQEAAQRNEIHDRLLAAIAKLPEREQEVCRLKFQQERTYREISSIMNLSLGTISKAAADALDAIRKDLRSQNSLAEEL